MGKPFRFSKQKTNNMDIEEDDDDMDNDVVSNECHLF